MSGVCTLCWLFHLGVGCPGSVWFFFPCTREFPLWNCGYWQPCVWFEGVGQLTCVFWTTHPKCYNVSILSVEWLIPCPDSVFEWMHLGAYWLPPTPSNNSPWHGQCWLSHVCVVYFVFYPWLVMIWGGSGGYSLKMGQKQKCTKKPSFGVKWESQEVVTVFG